MRAGEMGRLRGLCLLVAVVSVLGTQVYAAAAFPGTASHLPEGVAQRLAQVEAAIANGTCVALYVHDETAADHSMLAFSLAEARQAFSALRQDALVFATSM